MKIADYLRTYQGLRRENLVQRITVLILSLILLAVITAYIRREQVVLLTPYTLSGEAWVSQTSGSQAYKEAWALFFAQELGNVTPANIDFIRDRIANLISPSIYKNFMDVLSLQALQIKEDRLVLRFEPGSVEYEKETDKIFVTGRMYTRAFNEKETSEMRTFEFRIRLSNYAPELVWIDTYREQPHTQKFLRNQRDRQKDKTRSPE